MGKYYQMALKTKHICVCICTFKRPSLLKNLLYHLGSLHTEGLFDYSISVADNDQMQSASQVVLEFSAASPIHTIYSMEPEKNIALARNKALANARGDFIAFIDDDEFPEKSWLCKLFKTCRDYKVDGVLGLVRPTFEQIPPRWITKGKFFERPSYKTGYRLDWSETRTGNVLFKRKILKGDCNIFKAEFGTGSEDVDFFRRMMGRGCVFVWCNEAVVHEVVPRVRCRRRYLLRRALLRGSSFPLRPTDRLKNFLKSVIIVPLYTLSLPFIALFGQHLLVRYLIKLFDHSSRILAFLGWRLIRER